MDFFHKGLPLRFFFVLNKSFFSYAHLPSPGQKSVNLNGNCGHSTKKVLKTSFPNRALDYSLF